MSTKEEENFEEGILTRNQPDSQIGADNGRGIHDWSGKNESPPQPKQKGPVQAVQVSRQGKVLLGRWSLPEDP